MDQTKTNTLAGDSRSAPFFKLKTITNKIIANDMILRNCHFEITLFENLNI